MRFAQRLKQIRKELDIKQEELARACNVKLTAISKYENEIIKPSFDMLSKIGFAYNVNLNWLINEIGSMFIETSQRRLIKNGSDGFSVQIDESTKPSNISVDNKETSHSLDLTNDLKVEYYGANNENYTKIYHKNGEIEYCSNNESQHNFQKLIEKITEVCRNKNQFEFVLTAIDAIDNEEALKELKILIKGMEISKK